MDASLKVQFWGTRGWISTPSLQTALYGGNTSSLQVLHGDLLVGVDAGFGICNWGEQLAKRIVEKPEPLEIHVFLTRFHWDHIQGLSFFHPIYSPSTRLHLYAPYPKAYTREKLEILFTSPYSPFSGLDSMESHIEVEEISKEICIGDLRVQVGEKSEANGVAYRFFVPDGSSLVVAAQSPSLPGFAAGTDLLILDAACTEAEEKAGYPGWGGGTYEQALSLAQASQAKRLICTRHGPYRTDKALFTASLQAGFVPAKEGEVYSVTLSTALV